MDDRRGGFGQFFGAFANAMLERTLPTIRAWLESRLGATVDRMEVDGSRLHLFDVRVPIGALVLRVSRATLLTTAEELVAGRAPVRLERLEGELVATTDGVPTFTAPIELVGRAGGGDAWIDADVTIRGARWTVAHGVGDAAPMDGSARLRIGTDTWRLDDAVFVSGASRIELSARGRLGGGGALTEARLEATEARAGHFLDAIAAWTGKPLRSRLPIPWHAQLDGTVRIADRVGAIDLSLGTEESAIEVRGRVTPTGELRDATVRGTLGWGDLGPSVGALAGSAAIAVDVSAEGPVRRPDATASLRCPALVLEGVGPIGAARLDGRLADGAFVVDGAIERGATLIATLSGSGALPTGSDRVQADGKAADGKATDGKAADGKAAGSEADRIQADGVLAIHPEAIEGPLSFEGDPFEVRLALRGRALDVTSRVDALSILREGTSLSLRRIRARARFGAEPTFRADARVGPGAVLVERTTGPTKIVVQRVDAPSTVALAAIVSPRGSFGGLAWPGDAEVWADLVLEDGVAHGRAHVETARSRVSFLPLRAGRDGLDGTEAVGTIAFEELLDAGLFGGRLAPQPVGTFDAVARVRGRGDDATLETTLTAPSVGWTWDGAATVGVVVLRDARAELWFRRGAFEVRALSGEVFGGTLSAAGSIRREGERSVAALDHLRVTGCASRGTGGLRSWALGDRATKPGLEGLAADIELSMAEGGVDGGVEGRAHVRTDASDLSLTLSAKRGRWGEASGLRGSLSTHDLRPWLGGRESAPDPIGDAAWRIDGALGGSPERPRLSLRADAETQPISIGGARLELVAPSLMAALDGHGIRWSALDAGLLDGTVRSRGVIGFGEGFRGVIAELSLEGVQLEKLAEARDHVGGTFDGTLQLWQTERHPIGGRARLTLEAPRYPGLRSLADSLRRFVLPLPPLDGDAPLVAELRMDRRGVHVETLTASVPGLRLAAAGAISRAGRIEASAELVAASSWLRRSPRLRPVIGLLGSLTVPIQLGGTVARPALRVDVLGAIDRLIAKSELGRGLQRAIDRLLDDVEPKRGGAPRHHAPTGLSSTDTLVDRIAADAADASDALGALVERGLAPEEIADRVSTRRQR